MKPNGKKEPFPPDDPIVEDIFAIYNLLEAILSYQGKKKNVRLKDRLA